MSVRDPLPAAEEALATRRWDEAVSRFRAAIDVRELPESIDSLGLALWWTGQASEGIRHRAHAYAIFRERGELERAASIAAWLSREYEGLYRNTAAAAGWLARAGSALADRPPSVARGWLEVARSEVDHDHERALQAAEQALLLGRRHSDASLETAALARLGLLEVERGDVDRGVLHLDEAMAAATAGEVDDPRVLGDAYCAVMQACEAIGGFERLAQWSEALNASMQQADYPLLTAFCGACCGNLMMAGGHLQAAERELLGAISTVENTEIESRCVHPITQLADLRVVQGRFEEAEELLSRFEDLPEASRPLAALSLARGDASTAVARLRRRMRGLADRRVLLAPLLVLLVDAEIAHGDIEAAAEGAETLSGVAELTGSPRHRAEAAAARAKVAVAARSPEAAALLDEALLELDRAQLPVEAARVRLMIAGLLVSDRKDEAVAEARAALAAFDRSGARPDADRAAALLRRLGVGGRTGAKGVGTLTAREQEVLRLVAQGLSNAEIAARLFISTKTVGHHVSNMLSKLNLRSRTEAAAFAAVSLGPEPAPRSGDLPILSCQHSATIVF